jgi:ankyrin repeat protein
LLSYACYYFGISSSYQAIEYLINLGIDINVQDKKGYTPLMYLIAKSNNITPELVDCIKLLLNAKPNLDLKCNNSHNCLSIACINAIKTKDSSIIKLLIRAGANVNILSNFNANCMSFLCYKGPYLAIQLFDLLMDHMIDLNVQSKNTLNGTYDGYTSLHYAARGIVEKTSINAIIDLLLKNGADHTIRNNMNETYLDIIDIANTTKVLNQKYISMRCLVCFEENNNMMFMFDCGHCVSCESCSNTIIDTTKKCPYCRSTFKEFETIKMID